MADGEKIGLTGVFDNAQFHAGLAQYNADIDKATKTTEQSGKGMDAAWNEATQRFQDVHTHRMVAFADILKKNIPAGSKESVTATKEMGAQSAVLTGAIAGLVSGGTTVLLNSLVQVADAARQAAGDVGKFIAECTTGAARGEEMGVAASFLGQQAGYSAQQIADLTAELIKTGVTDLEAGTALAKLTRENLDATKAVDLLKVAQGASIISGEGVTKTYMSLIDAIANGQPKALKAYGLTLNQAAANEVYAASINKDAKALTEDEQKQAAMNAVLAQGSKMQGLYAEAMQMPSAQMRRINDELMPKLMDAIGTPFQQAFGSAVAAVSKLVEWITNAISEGGALYPVVTAVATAVSMLADGLSGLVKTATDAGDAFFGSFGGKMEGTANAALTWGTNIITQLANGIMQGAADALNAAMNAISGMLENWLAPGSPPRVAPDIDKWGAAAIGQWLGGFQQGDFSTLDAIQGPLQTALDLAFGKAGKDAAGKAFVHLSGDILAAINAGKMSQQLFGEIAAAAGPYGQQMALLVQDQVNLTAATREQTAAQEALTNAQKASSEAGTKVSAGIKEYNAMLRSGASKEALDAKMAEIKAAEKEKTAADKNAVVAQKSVETTTSKVDALKEMVALQAAIVSQQQKLAKAEESTPEASAAAPKLSGAGAPKLGALGGLPKPDLSGITSSLSTQIDKLKASATAKFQELWDSVAKTAQGLWGKVQAYFQPMLDNVSEGLAGMREFWEKHKGEVSIIVATLWEMLKAHAGEQLRQLGDTIKTGLDLASGIFATFWLLVNGHWDEAQKKILEVGQTFLTDLFNIFHLNFTDIQKAWADWGYNVGVTIGTFIGDTLRKFEAFKADVAGKIQAAMDGATKIIQDATALIQKAFDDAGTRISTVIFNATNAVATWVTDMLAKANEIVDSIKSVFSTDWGAIGQGIIDGIRDGVMNAAGHLASAAADAVSGAINAARNALGMHSPSRVFVEMGQNTMRAMGAGITSEAQRPASAVTTAMARSVYPAAMMPIMTGATSNVNMNMGGVNIYNPMNMAMFESMLTRVMRGAK